MKIKYFILFLGCLMLSSVSSKAQMAIGKSTIDGGGILDFASNTTNGIILPTVEERPFPLAQGILVFYRNYADFRVYANDAWERYSEPGNAAVVPQPVGEELGEGVVIGNGTPSGASGVLVLDYPTKALILPKIENPHLTVENPYPGMICYDTSSKSLALFNGSVWSYLEIVNYNSEIFI